MNSRSQYELEEVLDRQIEAARQLSGALAVERAALTGEAPDAVSQVAAEKSRLFSTIESIEAERRALWGAPEDFERAPNGPVADRWRTLLQLMAACRTANEVNGHIIHIRQNQIRQLIDIVRGGAPVTYGRQGKTFATALRALARA